MTGRIVDAAILVQRTIGVGCLEKVYQVCLTHELLKRGMRAEMEVGLPVVYDGQFMPCGYRVDILVEDAVIVETKAQRDLTNIDQAQLLNYLQLSGLRTGLLLNFGVRPLGIQRTVHG